MNARVEADPITLMLGVSMIECTIQTQINSGQAIVSLNSWVCFTPALISINGHSLSAINPETTLTGGMATLVMA